MMEYCAYMVGNSISTIDLGNRPYEPSCEPNNGCFVSILLTDCVFLL